jgi:hypothetical protein
MRRSYMHLPYMRAFVNLDYRKFLLYMHLPYMRRPYMHLLYMRFRICAYTNDAYMEVGHFHNGVFRICAYMRIYDDAYKCTYKCAYTDDNFLKSSYMKAHIYGRCIWITVNFFLPYMRRSYMHLLYMHTFVNLLPYMHLPYMHRFHICTFRICTLPYMCIYGRCIYGSWPLP